MKRIVVIEDNVQNARMANKLLKRAGYEVLLAEDGESGLTTVFENPPDLILIDLGLPDIDGQTVIGLVRQQEHLKTIPIIAFTAWPPEEAHDMATRYGCDGVITKPINTRTFAGQLGAFIPSTATEEDDTTSGEEKVVETASSSKSEATPGNTITEEAKIADSLTASDADKETVENKSDNSAESPEENTGD